MSFKLDLTLSQTLKIHIHISLCDFTMSYIKRLVMHGFKSFVKKTEIPFTSGINIILGPNGSGKSNISDALCFVLGRLSIKSMRAAKAKNLIFLGTKNLPPSKEAFVEVIFDNTDRVFSIDNNEISIKRAVRKNGQSIYKINNETKTRQEILFLLAQAGIDPNGFNIILQGEIQNFVRMHTEERRKVIEEVSGISVYEMRKEKSLKELERTESRLNEIVSILRERTAYLNNLEKERQQALRFKKLEQDLKRFKASIINFDLSKKKKEEESINLEISKKTKEIEGIKKLILGFNGSITDFESKISSINSTIQKSTGIEQEKLNQEIANIRAEIAGLSVRLENSEKRLAEIQRQKQELKEIINNNELSIKELQKSSGFVSESKKQKDLSLKKQDLEKIEEMRKKFYVVKSELKSARERLHDKKTLMQNYSYESENLLKQIESTFLEVFDRNTNSDKVRELKVSLSEKKESLDGLNKKNQELEKKTYANEYEIDRQNKLIEKISKMETCPVCKNKITEKHMNMIKEETLPRLNSLKEQIGGFKKELIEIHNKKESFVKKIEELNSEISNRESDLIKISNINEKQQQLKNLHEKTNKIKQEISELEKTEKRLEKNFDENSNIEQKYETVRIELQEISSRNDENVNSEILFKQGEFERSKISLKQLSRNEQNLEEDVSEIKKELEENETLLEERKEQEEELTKKFQRLISERDNLQKKIRETENTLSTNRNTAYNIEQEINNIKIQKARVGAEISNLETDMLTYPNIEPIRTKDREMLVERLIKIQEILSNIGTVNLRSLEVYDSIKKDYDEVKGKAETIEKEKEGILKIIHEIDIKKKKTFLKTLTKLNEIFSRNFSQLSTKGHVFLELENNKDPFEAGSGVQVIVKTGHGKYFDVKSLSGGEQTIVAISLIFAIQEYSPYPFYILDEIDAALDKRNSERLSGLLQKHMTKGQYIVITHNDEVITKATNLYGVSMHEGISKIISLRV